MRLYCILISVILFTDSVNAQLLINEYSAHKGLIDFGESHDWIEIYNNASVPIELSDYYLSDDIDEVLKWNLPNIQLQANDHITICVSGLDISEKPNHWESIVLAEDIWSYRLGNSEPDSNWKNLGFNDNAWSTGPGGFGYGDGDDNTIIAVTNSVYLRREFEIVDLSDLNDLVLHADFDDAFVAYLNGTEIARSDNILGSPPPFSLSAQYDVEALIYQGLEPFSITFSESEIQDLLEEGTNVLAVQVHNVNLSSSDLSSNFYLSASINSTQYNYSQIPSWFSPDIQNNYFHSNFKLSSSEDLVLSHENGNIIDLVLSDDELQYQISKGRIIDGASSWCYFNTPSPNYSNNGSICYQDFADTPLIDVESGWYSGSFIISLEESDYTIRYTTNGDVPSSSSSIYTEPLLVDSTRAFSFRAFSATNELPSKIVDRIYILDKDNYNLPVLSIHTNEENLWDYYSGIYVSGPGAQMDYPYFGSNFWEPWSKFSRLEYFDKNKNKVAEEHLDLEIHGGWSRAEPQKSFRFDFKSEYTGPLEYQIFNDKPELNTFNNFNVRNGGQHVGQDKIQDAIVSRNCKELNIDVQAYQPCILYLNGAYWGVYGIREKLDEHYVEANHNFVAEEIDLLNSFGVLNGTDEGFLLDLSSVLSADETGPFFYSDFSNLFDIENYIDYFVVQTYIQNMDWMGINWGANNIKIWRDQNPNARWRYMLYDTDGAFGYFGQNIYNNYIEAARNPSYPSAHSLLFDKVLDNNQFRCQFVNRNADIINTVFDSESLIETTDEIKNEIESAMPDHIDFWEAPESFSDWNESINSIIDYNSQRVSIARNHIEQSLDLNGQYTISLNVLPEGSGKIKISTVEPENYPWQGVYFNGCPVLITAEPNEGFEFSFWADNAHLSGDTFDSVLNINFFLDDIFIANFTPVLSVDDAKEEEVQIFPNPSTGILFLEVPNNQWNSFQISNSQGKIILESSAPIGRNRIDLTQFSDGLYFVELFGKNGDFLEKIIIEK